MWMESKPAAVYVQLNDFVLCHQTLARTGFSCYSWEVFQYSILILSVGTCKNDEKYNFVIEMTVLLGFANLRLYTAVIEETVRKNL